MIEALGWLGGALLSLCGLPLAWTCLRTKSSCGINKSFILLWGLGEVFTLIYVIMSREELDSPLIFNYLTNLTFIAIISYYIWRER